MMDLPSERCFSRRLPGGCNLARGFTLVELLVAMAVFALLLVLLMSTLSQVSSLWTGTNRKLDTWRSSTAAFETIKSYLGRATLNPYWDYNDAANPTRYLRKSDLAFVAIPAGAGAVGTATAAGQEVFFQARLGRIGDAANLGGLSGLLNPVGFYVSFEDDPQIPAFLQAPSKHRYRLMMVIGDTEANTIYTNLNDDTWFTALKPTQIPVGENVILLALRLHDPMTTGTPPVAWDSRVGGNSNPQPSTSAQLPSDVEVLMVAIDDQSADRLASGGTPPAALADALQGRFQNAAQFESDLEDLEAELSANRITYRVFRGVVPLKESRWVR